MNPPAPSRLISLAEAAEILHTSQDDARAMVSEGILRSWPAGTGPRFLAEVSNLASALVPPTKTFTQH